jgi:glycosyltransferase involved in cell wall biosynthesis
MDWPRITIVTPTFNRVEFLQECIESVLSQDYPNLEYIICDGGSKNPTLLDLIRKYEGRLAWWDSVPDRGHAEAIRRGFERSTGEVMNWLCSDDYFLPGALRAVGTLFREQPRTDVVYGHSRAIDAAGRTIKENRAIPYLEWAAFTTSCLYQPAAFWTRRLYDQVGGKVGGPNWENVVYEPNVELFCRFQKSRAQFRRIQVPLTALRVHDGAVGATQLASMRRVATQTFRRFYPICGHPLILPLIRVVMRLYQVGALIGQGDGAFLLGQLKSKVAALTQRSRAISHRPR